MSQTENKSNNQTEHDVLKEAIAKGRANSKKRMKEEKEFRDEYYPQHEFLPNTEYILFNLDRANFGRSYICVPKNIFEEIYKTELEQLRQESTSVSVEDGIVTYKFKMYLEQTVENENRYNYRDSFSTTFAHRMTHYSEEDLGYIKLFENKPFDIMDNKNWYRHSVGADLKYAKENTYLTEVFVFDEVRL
jgi:hypothetical protein